MSESFENHGFASTPYTYSTGQKNKRKMIMVVVFGVLGIVLVVGLLIFLLVKGDRKTVTTSNGVSISPTPEIKQVRDGQIIIADGQNLYQFNTADMRKTLLKIPELESQASAASSMNYPMNLSFTPDGNYLFFSDGDSLFVYDFELKSAQKLPISPNAAVSPNAISPNSVIAAVNTGTAPGLRNQTFVDFKAGKTLYKTTGANVTWAPDSQHFSLNTAGPVWWNLALGPEPQNTSITLGTVANTVTGKVVLKGTTAISYQVVKWLDDSNLLYQKMEYSKPIPPQSNANTSTDTYQDEWMKVFNSPKISYGIYNILDNSESVASESAGVQYVPIVQNTSPTGKWMVVTDGQQAPYAISIQNTKHKTEKFRISSGNEAVWRP